MINRNSRNVKEPPCHPELVAFPVILSLSKDELVASPVILSSSKDELVEG